MPKVLKPAATGARTSTLAARRAGRPTQASGVIKLGLMALAALLVLGLCGWWLRDSVIGGRNGGTSGGGGSSPDVPDELARLREIRDRDLMMARLDLMEPASSYINEWESLGAMDNSHRVKMDAYRQQRGSSNQAAGYLGAIGVDLPSPSAPDFPVDQLNDSKVQLSLAKRRYLIARSSYNQKAKRIQLEFEKQVSSMMGGARPGETPPPPADADLEIIVGRAEALLRQHDGLLNGVLWGFGSH